MIMTLLKSSHLFSLVMAREIIKIFTNNNGSWIMTVQCYCQQYLSYILVVSLIDGDWSLRRKPPTGRIHLHILSHRVVSSMGENL